MPKFQINGVIHFEDKEDVPTVVEIDAEDKEEAKFFFSHGVHVNKVNEIAVDATTTLDFRTLKPVCKHKWKRKYVEGKDTIRMFRVCKLCGYKKEVNGLVCYE